MITEPIKDNKELQAFLNFYADKKPNLRNHCPIVFGLNTALRISDILNIKWNMIYDFENKKFNGIIRAWGHFSIGVVGVYILQIYMKDEVHDVIDKFS